MRIQGLFKAKPAADRYQYMLDHKDDYSIEKMLHEKSQKKYKYLALYT